MFSLAKSIAGFFSFSSLLSPVVELTSEDINDLRFSPGAVLEKMRDRDSQTVEKVLRGRYLRNNSSYLHHVIIHGGRAHSRKEAGLYQCYLDIASMAIELGADVDAVDSHNYSCLMYAGRRVLPDFFSLLLDAGADVFACSDKGRTIIDQMDRIHQSPRKDMIIQSVIDKLNITIGADLAA